MQVWPVAVYPIWMFLRGEPRKTYFAAQKVEVEAG